MLASALRLPAILLILAGMATLGAGYALQEDEAQPSVMVAPLVGPIGPATTAFITRAIGEAEDGGAEALIMQMDTPGGLDTSTRDINQAILNADVPVVVYVSPPGARAASAGAFITYASHVAAMAPGTSIGAATPVQMGGGGGGAPETPEADPALEEAAGEAGEQAEEAASPPGGTGEAPSDAEAMRNKVVNDSVAYIRSLAELRGRNADWAEAAVREAASVSASDALELGVIEIVAPSLADLLTQLDGRSVTLQSGLEVTLATEGAAIINIEKSFAEEALATLTNPNIAFLLLNLGFIGLLVSFYNGLEPITGVAGVICLIVGLYALNTLPVNYAGAALIVLGLALLAAEAFIVSGGLLALGGLAAFAIGALMLVDTDIEAFRLDWRLVIGATGVLGVSAFLLLTYGLAALSRKVTTGAKGLIGQGGRVLDWTGEEGHVLVDGERWHARSTEPLSAGESIKVKSVDGLTLVVGAAK